MEFYLFTVTVPNIEEGKKIAESLVENKLAACVNIIKDIYSVYRWKGEIQKDNEHLLLIKTTLPKISPKIPIHISCIGIFCGNGKIITLSEILKAIQQPI